MTLDHQGGDLAESILRGATPQGIDLVAADMPKLKIPIRGGKLLSWFGKLYMSAIIGSLWQNSGHRRLCTLANPTDGVFDLGYVDLKTGWIKPVSTGPLSRERGPAERYLVMLRNRCPFEARVSRQHSRRFTTARRHSRSGVGRRDG